MTLPSLLELIECYIYSFVNGIHFKRYQNTMLNKRIGQSMYLNAQDIYYIQVNRQYTSNFLLDMLRMNYGFSHNHDASKYPDWVKVYVQHDLLKVTLSPTIHDGGVYYLQIFGEDSLIYLEVEIDVR